MELPGIRNFEQQNEINYNTMSRKGSKTYSQNSLKTLDSNLICFLDKRKLKQYQKRLNAKVKPTVYGNKHPRKRLTKEERLKIAEKRDRRRPYVLAGFCLFWLMVVIIPPIAITFGIKSTKTVEEDNLNFKNSSSV